MPLSVKRLLYGLPPLRRVHDRFYHMEQECHGLYLQVQQLRTTLAELQLERHFSRLEELLRLLRPKRVVGHKKIRLGRNWDGGYVMLDDFSGVPRAYSLGIGYEVSWDLAIAERGIPVFQFDYSVMKSPMPHRLFTFSQTKVQTLGDLSLPPQNKQILKLDIEGAEWGFFADASSADLSRFAQITVEFHDFSRYFEPAWHAQAKRALENLNETHQLIHLHGNNYLPAIQTAKYQVPVFLEATYALKASYSFEETDEGFPGPLDFPCHREFKDYDLGLMLSESA